MFFIYYLKLTNIGYALKPHLHNDYVLSFKNTFYVLSSKPINGLKSTYIHTPNINGKNKPQFIIENPHIYNSKHHIFEYSVKGMQYLAEHRENFKPVLEALKLLAGS